MHLYCASTLFKESRRRAPAQEASSRKTRSQKTLSAVFLSPHQQRTLVSMQTTDSCRGQRSGAHLPPSVLSSPVTHTHDGGEDVR
eukprot:scaffold230696_cov27-Tisochrysis_lutea.AAC.1